MTSLSGPTVVYLLLYGSAHLTLASLAGVDHSQEDAFYDYSTDFTELAYDAETETLYQAFTFIATILNKLTTKHLVLPFIY